MKKIARTLRSHRALILNYFRARKQFSSGVVEGLNNKAKLTMRKSYGFRTFRVTEIALYHTLGRLPEPDVAHRFSDEAKYERGFAPLTLHSCHGHHPARWGNGPATAQHGSWVWSSPRVMVSLTGVRICLLQASSGDDHGALCRD